MLRLAQTQQRHRHAQEEKVLQGQIDDSKSGRSQIKRGQFLGALVAIAALSVTAYLGYVKQPIPAAITGGGTLLAVIALIVTGERAKAKAKNSS